LKSWRCQLWIRWLQMQFYWRHEVELLRRIFVTQTWLYFFILCTCKNKYKSIFPWPILTGSAVCPKPTSDNKPNYETLCLDNSKVCVANAVLLATRSGASKTHICDRQIYNWHQQLFKYSTVIPILMKFSQCVHTSLKTYK
jgi:hypothetical protein